MKYFTFPNERIYPTGRQKEKRKKNYNKISPFLFFISFSFSLTLSPSFSSLSLFPPSLILLPSSLFLFHFSFSSFSLSPFLPKVGTSVEINAGIPEVIDGNVKIETTLNLASTQGKTKTTQDSFKVSHEIHIPPKSKVKAEITITGQ